MESTSTWGTTGYTRLRNAFLFLLDYGSAESNKKFQEGLHAFLEKWFTFCDGGNYGEVESESEYSGKEISNSAA